MGSVGVVGQLCLLLHCQASPEGLVHAASKVGQDLLTRPILTLNEQLAVHGVSSLKVNSYLKELPSLMISLSSNCLRANTSAHFPVTQLRLCFSPYHMSARQQFMVGCSLKILGHVVAHHPFVHLLRRFFLPFTGAVGVLFLFKHLDWWAQLHSLGREAHMENQGQSCR